MEQKDYKHAGGTGIIEGKCGAGGAIKINKFQLDSMPEVKIEQDEQKLCQKCGERHNPAKDAGFLPPPWLHCHHEEPEIDSQTIEENRRVRDGWKRICDKMVNKPEEKCWCTSSLMDRSGHFETVSERYDDGTPALSMWWDIFYCPHCGRKLNE